MWFFVTLFADGTKGSPSTFKSLAKQLSKEENEQKTTTEEQREAVVHQLSPGWSVMTSQSWLPKGTKPSTERMKQEILRRAEIHQMTTYPRPGNWSSQRGVQWLSNPELDAPPNIYSNQVPQQTEIAPTNVSPIHQTSIQQKSNTQNN